MAARQGRGRRIVGLLALFLGLAGAATGLIMLMSRVSLPVFQSLAIREYTDDRWPTNAWAVQDGQLLEQRFGATNSYAAQTGAKVMAELARLREIKNRPVVLHLCALARVKDGKVFILPGDADPDEPRTWLALDDVLRRLNECPAREKLLILDIMRPIADSRLGIYAEEVAAHTDEALRKADLPFLVLAACSEGQVSLTSQELGQSAFAYYLALGLAGHADRSGDKLVKARELAEFVKTRVDRWAWRNRGVRQTPALYGKGADFTLAHSGAKAGAPAAAAPAEAEVKVDAKGEGEANPADAKAGDAKAGDSKAADGKAPDGKAAAVKSGYPSWLKSHWAQRDGWRPELSRLGPAHLRRLEAMLLWAEGRWRGGDEDRARTQLQRAFNQAEAAVKIVQATRPPAVRSLRGVDAKQAAAFHFDLRKLLSQAENPALKDGKDKTAKEIFDKEHKDVQARLAKTPEAAARAIFDLAVSSPKLSEAQFLLLHGLLQGLDLEAAGKRPDAHYAEVLFLGRVKDFADRIRNVYEWPAAEVQQALTAIQLAETLVADLVAEPALWPWVAKDLEAADALRRQAEKDLFEGFPPWGEAAPRLAKAAALYRRALARAQEVAQARAESQRALRLLPLLAPILSAQRSDYEEEPLWDAAVREAEKLDLRLQAVGDGPLEGVVGLRQSLNDLERSLAAKEAACLEEGLKADDHAEIESLLTSAWLDAPRRENLWSAGRKLSVKLLRETHALDDADNRAPGAAAAETLPSDRSAAQREQRRRRWRGRQALAMIGLAGMTPKLDKENPAALAVLENNDAASWQKFAEAISNLWPREALAELKDPETPLARAERLTRLAPAFDLVRLAAGDGLDEPALAVHRREMEALLRHLGARGHADAAAAGAVFRQHYAAIAEAYQHEALRWR